MAQTNRRDYIRHQSDSKQGDHSEQEDFGDVDTYQGGKRGSTGRSGSEGSEGGGDTVGGGSQQERDTRDPSQEGGRAGGRKR
jgi:hypothetical protein